MKLMALASWMTNEEARVEEVKNVMRREGKEPVQIKAEIIIPRGVINNHQMIANDASLADRYINTQAQKIAHYDDISRLLGEECVMACQRKWNGLPLSLRNLECHTSNRLRATLERAPLYKRAMQTMKIKWPGLKLSPPLMLGLNESKEQIEEDKEWEEAEKNAGFYPPKGTPSMIPWDVREATRALKKSRKRIELLRG